jgi:hypothetical protein
MSAILPDRAAHVTTTEAIYTDALLCRLLDGQTFQIGGQKIRSAASEREILRQRGWASRPV